AGPATFVCVHRIGDPGAGVDLVIDNLDSKGLRATANPTLAMVVPFDGAMPERSSISALTKDVRYALRLNVTNGTEAAFAEETFLHQEESVMVITTPANVPPVARFSVPSIVECTSPSGAMIALDASASDD